MYSNFITLILILSLAIKSYAAEQYLVKDININFVDTNIVKAKEYAVNEGIVKAFNVLLDVIGYPLLNIDDKLNLVSSYEVVNEQIKHNSYNANLNVYFDAQTINNRIIEKGLRADDLHKLEKFLIQESSSTIKKNFSNIIYLPVIKKNNQIYVWENDNIFIEKIHNLSNHDNAVFPAGDIEDINLTKNLDIYSHEKEDFIPFMNRYKANKIIILLADVKYNKDNNKYFIEISKKSISNNNIENFANFISVNGKNLDDLFDRIINKLSIKNNNDYNYYMHSNQKNAFLLEIEYKNLHHYQKIEREIKTIDLLKSFNVIKFSNSRFIVELLFNGQKDYFLHKLTELGYNLRQQNEIYILGN